MIVILGLHQWLSNKESACNAGDAGDLGSIPGLGRSPVRGLGNPLQYSCLENPMDRGAWWATVRKFIASDTTEATGCTHTVILAVLGFALIMFMFKLILLKRGLCFVCLFNFFVI